ncbi:unnamed protein product [Plutella xylostella]|uniref:(diamondback moth) hypothetical protein n=1 Tax=Plutella xylostella TaxID=51655 RepID=A0A8S4GCQ5_PLUXY|nr:unnamed protein product [Plutella xylostella]
MTPFQNFLFILTILFATSYIVNAAPCSMLERLIRGRLNPEQKTSWNRRSAIPNEDPAIRKPLVVSSKVYDVLKQLQDKEELKDEVNKKAFLKQMQELFKSSSEARKSCPKCSLKS